MTCKGGEINFNMSRQNILIGYSKTCKLWRIENIEPNQLGTDLAKYVTASVCFEYD